MSAALKTISVLVPGRLHERSLRRIGETFSLVQIDRADPALITGAMRKTVRGMAVSPALGGAAIHAPFMEALPNLEIIANFGVGYDGVDAAHAGGTGIMVTNTPDVLTDEVADTALGLLLNTVREFSRAEAWLRQGRWPEEGAYPLTQGSLRGRMAGIFGMGRIGQAIARRLEAFGVPVAYHNRRKIEGARWRYFSTLTELAANVDILICAAPGGAATEKIVGESVFTALGPDGVFINIGRGGSVDETALLTALHERKILAAGLDVYANEPNVPSAFLELPNLTLLPHVGSASIPTRNAMADLVVDNLISWFQHGRALTPVPEAAEVKAREHS